MTTPSTIPTPISNEAALKGAYMMSGDFSDTQGKQLVHLSVAQDLERRLSIALAALEQVRSGLCYPDGYFQVSNDALSEIQSLSQS